MTHVFGQPDIHNTVGIGLRIPEITEDVKEGGPLTGEGLAPGRNRLLHGYWLQGGRCSTKDGLVEKRSWGPGDYKSLTRKPTEIVADRWVGDLVPHPWRTPNIPET